jgi:hypothetical protein
MQPEPAVPDTTEPDATGLAGHCPHGVGMLDACDPCESSTTEPDEPQDTAGGWSATAWLCSCCAVNWQRWRWTPPGRPAAPDTPWGVRGGLFSHNTLDEFFAQHRDITPVEVDNQAALLADLTRVTRQRDEAWAQIRRYEGTGNDSKLTYAELEQERDRLALELYRAQDCGHDLEAFQRQGIHLDQMTENAAAWMREAQRQAEERDEARRQAEYWKKRTETAWERGDEDGMSIVSLSFRLRDAEAERDRLADTVRRYQPVIDAAKAWRQMRSGTPTRPKPTALALIEAVDALDTADDQPGFRPMVGTVTGEDARFVARATGGGITSADLPVEFEAETGQRDEDLAEIDTTEKEIVGPQTYAISEPIFGTWPGLSLGLHLVDHADLNRCVRCGGPSLMADCPGETRGEGAP